MTGNSPEIIFPTIASYLSFVPMLLTTKGNQRKRVDFTKHRSANFLCNSATLSFALLTAVAGCDKSDDSEAFGTGTETGSEGQAMDGGMDPSTGGAEGMSQGGDGSGASDTGMDPSTGDDSGADTMMTGADSSDSGSASAEGGAEQGDAEGGMMEAGGEEEGETGEAMEGGMMEAGGEEGMMEAGGEEEGEMEGGEEEPNDVPDNDYCREVKDWDPAWAAFEEEVLRLTNERRAAGATCGGTPFGPTGPLTNNWILRCSARVHSLDMFRRGFYAHNNPDGEDPFDRMERAGYDWGGGGENIAKARATPQAAVDAWMGSPPHCSAIMEPRFKELGVGYHPGGSGFEAHVWTQNFGTPR